MRAETAAAERLARNTAVLSASSVVTSALLLLWHMLLGRTLGPETYGVYGTIGAFLAIAAVATDFGMGPIMIREIARAPMLADRYLRASLVLHMAFASVAWVLVQVAGWAAGYDDGMRLLLAFAGVSLVVDAVGTVGHERLVAAERMSWTAAIGVAHVALLAICGAAALLLGARLGLVYAVVIAAAVVRAVLYWTVVRRQGWQPAASVDRVVARRLLQQGWPIGVAALLSIAFVHVDKLVTTAIIGTAGTGQLLAAFVLIFGVTELIGSNVLVASMPVMARDAAGAQKRVPAVVEHLLFVMLFVGVSAAIVLITAAGPIVSLLFGAGYGEAAAVLRVMGWFVIVRLVSGLFAQTLMVMGRQRAVMVGRAGGLLVNVVATVSLLPRIGVTGAAFGMVAGELVVTMVMTLAMAPSRDWWGRQAQRLVRLAPAVGALAWSTTWLAAHLPPAAAVALGLALYAGLAVLTGAMTSQHLTLIRHVGARALAVVRPGLRGPQ